MEQYTCIDSFCGAGGLGLGLKRAGFEILLSFDIDQRCIETINSNKKYFNHPAVRADIANMLNGELLKRCELKRGELFLLAGGPPCQGFSIQRRGSDIDARNELVLMYGKLINEIYSYGVGRLKLFRSWAKYFDAYSLCLVPDEFFADAENLCKRNEV